MAESVFGDSALFDEFEREAQPSDTILKQTILKEESNIKHNRLILNKVDDEVPTAEFTVGSTESSDSDDSDNNGELQPKITGVSDVVHSLSVNGATEKTLHSDQTFSDDEKILNMQMQLEKLSRENALLKKRFRMISSDSDVSTDWPAVQVIFMNHNIARKHKTEVEDFIHHLIVNDYEEQLPYLHLRPTSMCLSWNSLENVRTPNEMISHMQNHTAIGCEKFYKEFLLDSMGWPLIEYNPSLTDGWCTPMYEQVFLQSLPLDEDEDLQPKKTQRAKTACFNCGGEHNLKDCKEIRDPRKIAKARQDFQGNSSVGMKKQRYIQDESSEVNKFMPGKISNNLREALGINSKQLAPFIYQMRILGYPPGWLEDAEVASSGVMIFDKHGKELCEDMDSAEDGEIELKGQEKKYDTKKLISYPGFNVEPEKETIDEFKKLNMPPMQACHQKKALELFLTPAQPLQTTGSVKKRRSTTNDYPGDNKKIKQTDSDEMDLADSGGEQTGSEANSNTQDSSNYEKLSLTKLEDQQEHIKAELAAMGNRDDSPVTSVTDNKNDSLVGENGVLNNSFIPPLPPTPELPALPPGTPPVTPQSCNNSDGPKKTTTKDQVDLASGSYSTPKSLERPLFLSVSSSGSLSSAFGTPVLENKSTNNSVGKGLPQASKFAAGITEHIPFENLPEATGKYSQMRKVLDWVRSKNDTN